MRSRSLLPALLAIPLLVIPLGCTRGGGNGTDGGTDGGSGIEGPSNPGSCSDGIDNDHNGAIDCNDVKCQGTATCNPDFRTIYDVNDTTSSLHPQVDQVVSLKNEIVTAVLVQHDKNTGAPYWNAWIEEAAGGAYSGIEIIGSPTEVHQGDQVDVTGSYTVYFGTNQIKVATVTVSQSGVALPAPLVVDPAVASVPTGTGANQAGNKYTGVLAEVDNVTVTNAAFPGTDGKDHGDCQVTGNLVIGHNFAHVYTAMRKVGDQFNKIVGILDYSYNFQRLEPRADDDLTFADGTHPAPTSTTVQAIQNTGDANHPTVGTPVSFGNVVITAFSALDSNGRVHMAVEDPAGGQWSGIYIYNLAGVDTTTLSLGDEVTVEGQYQEYTSTGDTDSVSEIALYRMTKTGTGTVPGAFVSDPVTLSTSSTAEPYEGVLVEADNLTVSAATNSYGETTVDNGLEFGGLFWTPGTFQAGDTITKVVGVLHWNHGWIIEPRSTDDLVPGSIQPVQTVTIAQIQNTSDPNYVASGTLVKVVGAVVTAVDTATAGRTSFYIEDPAGGQWSGVYVYDAAKSAPTVAVGDQVTVQGTTSEYNNLTELGLSSVTKTGTQAVPAPVAVSDLTGWNTTTPDDPAIEPYEGVLVTFQKSGATMSVDAAATNGNFTVDSSALHVGGRLFAFSATAGMTLTSVTGVIDYRGGTSAYYQVLPRDASDVVQ